MSGIQYIVEDLSDHPECPHGPTLLFSRCINSDGDRRNFFACSACRDRKYCSFFLWENDKDKITASRKQIWHKQKQNILPSVNHRKTYIVLNEIQQLNEDARGYCFTCNLWILPKSKSKHSDHDTKFGVSKREILYPSTFLTPLNNDKKEAQYLFSNSSVDAIIHILQLLQIKHVLCIGAPRIHEHILADTTTNMSSLLLDLDYRFHNFFGPLQFCWYNLFNHHFFLPSSKDVYQDFLQSDSGKGLAVIIDPPFGGRVEPIAYTLQVIERKFQSLNITQNNLPIFLFFPYFMEPQIQNSLPDYKMADYIVDYDNHPLFQAGSKGRKFGSPVRIFTNLALSKIDLSEQEGYKYCSICSRWVYKENSHCNICQACTSKDGRTYVHCKKCSRCVKPSWEHCEKCNRCAQPDHKCGDIVFNQTCFHCKEIGHKKRDCPKVDHERLKKKRNRKMEDNKNKKRLT